MKRLIPCFVIALVLTGCPAPESIQKEIPPPPTTGKKPLAPDIVVKVASLNISKYSKKIERDDILKLSSQIKQDSIDILTIEGITRYPEIKTRVDIVEELASAAEMRKIFGETIMLTGRQNGNAVFSVYPIRSSEQTPYDRLHSANFEGTLQAVIDCGVRELVVVSTLVPEKASLNDLSIVSSTLGTFNNLYINRPIIISGNLPKSDDLRALAMYDGTQQLRTEDAPCFWFSKNGSLKLISQRTGHTVFGTISVVRIGIFRQQQP